MMGFLSPGWTFMIYAVVCVGGWVLVWTIYPETTGLELEEVRGLLEDGWGVAESIERWEGWRAEGKRARATVVERRNRASLVRQEDRGT